jgi:hypothetical protein
MNSIQQLEEAKQQFENKLKQEIKRRKESLKQKAILPSGQPIEGESSFGKESRLLDSYSIMKEPSSGRRKSMTMRSSKFLVRSLNWVKIL